MIYLLDSNAIRDLMDDRPRVVARLSAAVRADVVATCSIVRGEVLFGIERLGAGKRRDRLAQRAGAVFASLLPQPVPFEAGDHYARVKRERERAGLPMDENDLWIAATALVLGAVLVSRDADFTNVAGLSVEDWTV
jgi:predicted nucleic acid-binding protein